MKEVFVVLTGTMKLSGVSTWVVNLSQSLVNSGKRTIILNMGEPSEVAMPEGVDVIYLRRPRTHIALRLLRLFLFHKIA
ncbi:hypothetical protein M3P05_20010, partial [Sansalvadorimonas sp. 2012CJ34-2]